MIQVQNKTDIHTHTQTYDVDEKFKRKKKKQGSTSIRQLLHFGCILRSTDTDRWAKNVQ